MRLGGSPRLLEPLPPKPKGMRWRTFGRLGNEAVQAQFDSRLGLQAWLEQSEVRAIRIVRRCR